MKRKTKQEIAESLDTRLVDISNDEIVYALSRYLAVEPTSDTTFKDIVEIIDIIDMNRLEIDIILETERD